MSSYYPYITATDVMNYLYDPRIIYYIHVLKIPQTTTVKEIEGRKKYQEFAIKSKRTKIIRELPYLQKRYEVFLISEKLQCATKIDCIAFDKNKNEAYPIQIKYSFRPRLLYRPQKFQLVMEAMLIEERLGYKTPYCFVKFLKSGDFVRISITEQLKRELLQIFEEIKSIIREEKLPKPTPHKKKRIDSCYKNIE